MVEQIFSAVGHAPPESRNDEDEVQSDIEEEVSEG